mmetsp:Transcript_28355/g.42947  ORF Transcript_28355/g.42947 Transcript_28355/m.42947 type:complete len:144 (+) Transcript_28355:272-703(+)
MGFEDKLDSVFFKDPSKEKYLYFVLQAFIKKLQKTVIAYSYLMSLPKAPSVNRTTVYVAGLPLPSHLQAKADQKKVNVETDCYKINSVRRKMLKDSCMQLKEYILTNFPGVIIQLQTLLDRKVSSREDLLPDNKAKHAVTKTS